MKGQPWRMPFCEPGKEPWILQQKERRWTDLLPSGVLQVRCLCGVEVQIAGPEVCKTGDIGPVVWCSCNEWGYSWTRFPVKVLHILKNTGEYRV